MKKTGEDYPCGPCELPLECYYCGCVITEENVDNDSPCAVAHGCDVCEYCGVGKCPSCGRHWHCGWCAEA